MIQCWKMSPEDRPNFKEIYYRLSKFIERIAGYLEIGFNPFTGRGEEVPDGTAEAAEDERVDSSVDINVYTVTGL